MVPMGRPMGVAGSMERAIENIDIPTGLSHGLSHRPSYGSNGATHRTSHGISYVIDVQAYGSSHGTRTFH